MADETKGGPNRPIASWIPKSQRNSGVDLDEICGDVGQAEAGSTATYDSAALRELNKEKS